MQVILKTDVPHLGNAGEVVSVKPGYGANYLLPQGLALPATGANKHRIEHQRRIIEARLVRDRRRLARRCVHRPSPTWEIRSANLRFWQLDPACCLRQ